MCWLNMSTSPNKSSVFYSLLYVLLAAKLLLYGHQGHKQLGWETVPLSHMFYWRATGQLLKVTRIELYESL